MNPYPVLSSVGGSRPGEVLEVVPVVDRPAFDSLVQELSCRAWALTFVDAFTSMLESRIARIGSAFEVRDEEEGRVAMLSLMASAAMVGAARLHTVVTTALVAPFFQVDGGSLVGTLRVEAHRFRSSLDAFAV